MTKIGLDVYLLGLNAQKSVKRIRLGVGSIKNTTNLPFEWCPVGQLQGLNQISSLLFSVVEVFYKGSKKKVLFINFNVISMHETKCS